MPDRRSFLSLTAAAAAMTAFARSATPAAAATVAEMGADGLHKEKWFSVTFRDLHEDISDAKAEGKRLAIVFEQRGCIYCKRMHEEILSDPDVRDYIEKNFMMVQYNMFGDEGVTDLDGEKLTEKTAARKWGLLYTPTIMFMPEDAPDAAAGKTAATAAVAVLPGGFGKWTFLDMFKWVEQKGYDGEEHFQKFHARMLDEARKEGKLAE